MLLSHMLCVRLACFLIKGHLLTYLLKRRSIYALNLLNSKNSEKLKLANFIYLMRYCRKLLR